MNLLAANDFTYYLKYVFADWAIALFIFFAVLILLAVLFKGLKVGIILLVIAAAIAGGFVLAAFIFMMITWDLLRLIDFAIKWVPTILFVTIITVSTLVNAKRGLRKSLILLAQAVGACIVCTVFFYVCANSEDVDKAILGIVNTALGKNTLQGILGVSESCKTLREILAEYLPKLLGGDFQILLAENPQYIITLADMAFRLVFTVITIILYFLLVFLLYIIYFFAYPERRHKKKVELALSKNQTDKPYTKNHIGGGAVGLVRGITVGLLSLSFIGSVFFMVAGGKGSGTLGVYDFDNDDYNYYYSIYRSIDSYGSQGIFKVLNSMTDANDTPFYLFAADMVLSGNLDDEENDIDNKNIKFREEIAAFTGFAKDTMNLLMKYGEEDITAILNGKGGDKAFDTIVRIMAIPGFRTEFDLLIEEFDSQTYIINLGMSLVNSIVANIDDISFASSLSADNKELIKVLFKKGHLSEIIPDELKLKQDIAAGIVKPSDAPVQPRIKISHLLNKKDVRVALQIALSFISGEVNTKDVLSMIKTILPAVKQLSILQTSRASELDPVLARMYCFVENKYLTAEGETGITYKAVAGKKIKWLNELNTLINVTDDALTLWGNIYTENRNALEMALAVFDQTDENYDKNIACFNNITKALESSEIIGTVMSTSYMHNLLTLGLTAVSAHIYIPENLVYSRQVDADGNIVDYGELYKLFGGFKLLAEPQNSGFFDSVMNIVKGGAELDVGEILETLSDALASEDEEGNTLSYYLTESGLLRSLISIVMIDIGSGTIYIPDVALEQLKNGDRVNLIEKGELKQLFDNLGGLMEFVKPILSGGDLKDCIGDIAEYIQSKEFDNLLANSRICEGTAAHYLMDFLGDNEYIVLPKSLAESMDGWVTVNGKKGELRNLLTALKSTGIDIAEIAQGEFDTNKLLDTLLSMDSNATGDMLKSKILHYTISDYLLQGTETGGFEIIVPNGARERTQDDDSVEFLVKKSEIVNLFEVISRLNLSGDTEISGVLSKLVANKDVFDASRIISASIVYTIVNNDDITGAVTIPENYRNAGSKTSLLDYNSSNVWKAELPRFIDALDEILGISKAGEDFTFDPDGITESLSSFLTELNDSSYVNPEITKLQLCYRSDIVWSEINVRLDDILLGNGIVTEDVLNEAKTRGKYKLEEVQALSNALDIFGLDNLLDADSDAIINAVTSKALTLNDPLEEYGGDTALEVIYRSIIIQYVFSNELDKALEGNIEKDVVSYIKNGSRNYALSDVAAFIDAVKELGIEDFSQMEGFDLANVGNLNNSSSRDPEKTRLDVIYASRITAGVITKQLRDGLNSGGISEKEIDHPKAYTDGVKIYKQSEIESIYTVFGDTQAFDENFEFDIKDVDLGLIKDQLYDENGDTHSYLLASAISAILIDNENFVIPVDVLDEAGCIQPRESARVLNVFIALSEGKDLDDMENWEITEIPKDENVRKDLVESAILRARVTGDIGEQSEDPVYVSLDCVTISLDTGNQPRRIISESEFGALINALDNIKSDEESSVFEMPKFTLEDILSYDEETLELLLKSDIVTYKLSECLLREQKARDYLELNGMQPDKKKPIDLRDGSTVENEIDVINGDIIVDVCEYIRALRT